MDKKRFQKTIWEYYAAHKRDFSWRPPALKLRKGGAVANPYYIVVSEIMLQQTQVGRVEPKYQAFIKAFPNFASLACADIPAVLRAWQGLGYNRRGLYLKKLSEIVTKKYGGRLPRDPKVLHALPGIGTATAGSIAAFAFNEPVPFIETNIRRVYIHFFFPKKKDISDADIMRKVEATMDLENPREWYYALMDYGTMLAKREKNPNRRSRHYRKQPKFEGSLRQLRGQIVKMLLARKSAHVRDITHALKVPHEKARRALGGLRADGLVRVTGAKATLS